MTGNPMLLVVSGPNGSGKTTLARQYAKDFDADYIGADAIAEQIAPNAPEKAQISAAKQFSDAVHHGIESRRSLVVESTLSGRTFTKFLEAANRHEFNTIIVHLFVDSADLCVARVSERVAKGGHDVPEADIRRRFRRSAHNFWNLYRPLADSWILLYNATQSAELIATGDQCTHRLQDAQLFRLFQTTIASDD